MTPTRWAVFVSLAIWCAIGCVGPTRPGVPAIPPGEPTAEELAAAPEQVDLAGRRLVLQTYLWRDFMPISPPDGMPLVAVVRVVDTDSTSIPPGLSAERLWVINDGRTWATAFSDEPMVPTPGYVLQRIARDGPKWGPGIRVAVVVGLRIGSGDLHLLRAADQWIARTD